MLKYVTLCYVLYSATLCDCERNNVCRSFEDYRTIHHNTNCWHNPDVDASPKEVAERYGYPFESYEITTRDGYIINLFRIPHNGSDIDRKRPVVFLQHGIAADASTWMLLGAKSIVFVFASKGYDVWISNCRGSKYSPKHVRFTVYDPQYWNFSFHELALYDIPAMLDFINQKTNQTGHITYVGHSMGSTISYIYASLVPQEAKKTLKAIVSLAPVAYMDHVRTIGRKLVPFRYLIWDFLTSLGLYGLGPNIQGQLDLSHKLCSQYPFISICLIFTALLAGANSDEIVPSNFPIGFSHFPSGFSLKTLLHYAQIMAEKRRFQQFDYGPELNWKFYNSSRPPVYPVRRINIPVHLFYGRNDFLASEKDAFYLYKNLKTEKTIKEVFNFAHLDFLSSAHAFQFYETLLNYL